MSTHIGISLGWNCGAATHGVSLGIRKRKKEGYKTCPFDIMNTNIPGIIKCLQEDFKHFTDPDYLKLIDIPTTEMYHAGDKLIINTRYGFIFNHESPGHANLYTIENWEGGIDHFVKDKYSAFKKRYDARIQNFREYIMSGEHIIFLVNHPYQDYNKLGECIRNVYPGISFTFYNTNREGGRDVDMFKIIHKQMGVDIN